MVGSAWSGQKTLPFLLDQAVEIDLGRVAVVDAGLGQVGGVGIGGGDVALGIGFDAVAHVLGGYLIAYIGDEVVHIAHIHGLHAGEGDLETSIVQLGTR